jgi:hypothetical protein
MPFDHNHDKWIEKKKKRDVKYVEGKSNKRVKFSLDVTSKNADTKTTTDKDDKHPSKPSSALLFANPLLQIVP